MLFCSFCMLHVKAQRCGSLFNTSLALSTHASQIQIIEDIVITQKTLKMQTPWTEIC
jgi:hypothetical protein